MNTRSATKKAPVFTRSFELHANFSRQDLDLAIASLGTNVMRAKGVIGQTEFDFVHGSFVYSKHTSVAPYLNIITVSPMTPSQILIFEQVSDHSITHTIQSISSPMIPDTIEAFVALSEERVDKLVSQYHAYMAMDAKISMIQSRFQDGASDASWLEIARIQAEQKALGESMKYPDPYSWLEYKRRAYARTPKKVETVAELREHSKSPTYICHKRLDFLVKILLEKHGIDLFDPSCATKTIDELLQSDGAIVKLSMDKEVMSKWAEFEYFETDGRIAKWENYLA